MNAIKSSLQSSAATVVGIFAAFSSFAAFASVEKTDSRHCPTRNEAGEIICLAEVDNSARENKQAVKEGAEVSLSGKLKGGMAGIGGEHTGWVLEYQTKTGPQQIEVDCSGLDAASIHEGPARITGRVFKKNYLERGPVLILKATKIERLPTAAAKSDTQAARHRGKAG